MKTHPGKLPLRIILYSRDVENITGRSGRTARKMIQKVRLALGKSPDEFITVREFCNYFGIDEELVSDFLRS